MELQKIVDQATLTTGSGVIFHRAAPIANGRLRENPDRKIARNGGFAATTEPGIPLRAEQGRDGGAHGDDDIGGQPSSGRDTS